LEAGKGASAATALGSIFLEDGEMLSIVIESDVREREKWLHL